MCAVENFKINKNLEEMIFHLVFCLQVIRIKTENNKTFLTPLFQAQGLLAILRNVEGLMINFENFGVMFALKSINNRTGARQNRSLSKFLFHLVAVIYLHSY